MNPLTWIIALPARVQFAHDLLREYEAEQAPMTYAEAQAALANVTKAIESGEWERREAPTGVSAWREATARKAHLYPET